MEDIITASDTPSSSSQSTSSLRIICRVIVRKLLKWYLLCLRFGFALFRLLRYGPTWESMGSTDDVYSMVFHLNYIGRERCQKQFSQYTCPRCNTRYCSLHCYKSHSLRCTESFMRENVLEELRHLQPQDETKQKMLDILKRFHTEEDMDIIKEDADSHSESTSFLSDEAVQKILSGNEINLDDLSLEEQKEFQRMIASGELSKLIKPWDPWWLRPSAEHLSLSPDGTQLVQPLDNCKDEEVTSLDQGHEIPPGPEAPLPSIHKLREGEPSPLLAVHLVDMIYSYCFTLRLYNGDWKSDPLGASIAVTSVSSVLGKGGLPETVLEALSYCLEKTCSPAFKHMGGAPFGLLLMDDIVSILDLGRAAIICLLCDLQKLIEAGEKELRSERSMKSQKKELMTSLKSAEKKVYFFMCWANEQPKEAWSSLALLVKAEKSSAAEYANNTRAPPRMDTKIKAGGKPLIREVQ